MKIAVTGKGGVGKTTVSALLSREFVRRGYSVLAVDADPDSNLAAVLGFPEAGKIRPIMEQKGLIIARTGAGGGLIRLNPRVDDIPATHSALHDGIRLIVMGGVRKAGGGCACPENVFLKEILNHILTGIDEVVVVDMEAGIEHLGRATAESVDLFIIVVEPSILSVDSARRISELAGGLGIKEIVVIANKIRSEREFRELEAGLGSLKCAGAVPFSRRLSDSSLSGAEIDTEPAIKREISRLTGSIIHTHGEKPNKRGRT